MAAVKSLQRRCLERGIPFFGLFLSRIRFVFFSPFLIEVPGMDCASELNKRIERSFLKIGLA